MSAARCDLTDLLVGECAHCRGLDLDTPADNQRRGPVFRARWPGRCASCHQPVHVGDPIAYLASGAGVAHDNCEDTA